MSEAHPTPSGSTTPLWGPLASNGQAPALPAAAAPAGGDALLALRRFHHGAGAAVPLPDGLRPALMPASGETPPVPSDYPLLVPADPAQTGGRLCVPLLELLNQAVAQTEPGPEQAAALTGDLEMLAQLGHAVPEGRVVGFDEHTALWLLDAAVRQRTAAQNQRIRDELRSLATRLSELLEVEDGKAPDARAPEALEGAIGTSAGGHLDPQALAEILGPHRGTERLPAERRARIEQARQTLRDYVGGEPPPLLTLLHDDTWDPGGFAAPTDWRIEHHGDACATACAVFDREAARLVQVFRAARTARLELNAAYDEDRHGPWLAALDWQAFSREELRCVPTVVALTTAEQLASGSSLPALTRLLVSGRPLQVLALQNPAHNPTAGGGAQLSDYRLELGYLGIGHRQAIVQQSSTARPEHLARGFACSFDATRASLHVLASDTFAGGPSRSPGAAWLHLGAALEARAHPVFRYDPDGGPTWARRLDFSGNPQPERAWPDYPLRFRRGDGDEQTMTVAFTFADFALLEPELGTHFALVPDGCDDADLVPLADHLELSGEEAARSLPFVWAVQPDGQLCRLVVSRSLELACQDRASFWRSLQELAGVHNEYVEVALQRAEEQARAAATAERDELLARHRDELRNTRDTAVGAAMQGLAQSLLTLDPESFVREVAAAPAPATTAPAADAAAPRAADTVPKPEVTTPETPQAEVAPAAAPPSEEPWVESALCTSCNDCVQINSLLFVYDANKQVTIGNASAGTFAQLVKAAEKCPARCIHPGQPLNADEPGLDALRRRAEPFNV